MAAEAADTVTVARAIFNNMGVAFPGGTCQEILLTLMSGDYMGGENVPNDFFDCCLVADPAGGGHRTLREEWIRADTPP